MPWKWQPYTWYRVSPKLSFLSWPHELTFLNSLIILIATTFLLFKLYNQSYNLTVCVSIVEELNFILSTHLSKPWWQRPRPRPRSGPASPPAASWVRGVGRIPARCRTAPPPRPCPAAGRRPSPVECPKIPFYIWNLNLKLGDKMAMRLTLYSFTI